MSVIIFLCVNIINLSPRFLNLGEGKNVALPYCFEM